MYKEKSKDQQKFEDFYLPFGEHLNLKNRWIVLNKRIPRDKLEADYTDQFSSSGMGAPAKSFRMALKTLVIKEKLYRVPGLSLPLLAESMKENPNHLSQVINVQNGRTFHDLISHYRVGEFQSRISEVAEKRETILFLAFECGFNSKSTFNHIFKDRTGLTPSQYIRFELDRK